MYRMYDIEGPQAVICSAQKLPVNTEVSNRQLTFSPSMTTLISGWERGTTNGDVEVLRDGMDMGDVVSIDDLYACSSSDCDRTRIGFTLPPSDHLGTHRVRITGPCAQQEPSSSAYSISSAYSEYSYYSSAYSLYSYGSAYSYSYGPAYSSYLYGSSYSWYSYGSAYSWYSYGSAYSWYSFGSAYSWNSYGSAYSWYSFGSAYSYSFGSAYSSAYSYYSGYSLTYNSTEYYSSFAYSYSVVQTNRRLLQVSQNSECQATVECEIEYVPSCLPSWDAYCAAASMVPDYVAIEAHAPTSCSLTYCFLVEALPQPVLDHLDASQGPTSGGTLVTLHYSHLPCFSASDITVSAGLLFARVEALSVAAGSSMSSNRGTIVIEMPRASARGLAHFRVLCPIKRGLRRSFSFFFEYLPLVTGRARCVDFAPRWIWSDQTLDLSVEVSNVPRLPHPYDPSQIMIQVANITYPADSIVFSSHDGTRATLSVPGPWHNMDEVLVFVYHAAYGPAFASSVTVGVERTPCPTVQSYFPRVSVHPRTFGFVQPWVRQLSVSVVGDGFL